MAFSGICQQDRGARQAFFSGDRHRHAIALLFALFGPCCASHPERAPEHEASPQPPTGPVLVRLRVFVDPAVGTIGEAETRLRDLLDPANRELGRTADMALQLESVSTWNRKRCTGPESGRDLQTIVVPDCRGATLEEALRQLAIADPAREVELVLGLLPPLPVGSASFHQLGASEMLGRHIVLRSLDNVEEPAGEGRRHKEAMLLLHHLGHAFGALHTQDPTWVMSARYASQMTGFAPDNLALLAVAPAYVTSADPESARTEWMAALGETIDSKRWDGWVRADMFRALLYLGVATELPDDVAWIVKSDPSEGDTPPTGEEDPNALPDSPEERALLFMAKDRPEDAWEAIQRALGADATPSAQLIACRIAARRPNKTKEAIEQCRSSIDGAPDEPEPALILAVLLLDAADEAGARAAAESAARRLDDRAPAELWLSLAQIFRALGDLQGAEEAALGARELPRGQEILEWARAEQQRLGVSEESGSPRVSRDLLRVIVRADQAYSEGKYAEAIQIARKGLARDPRVVALLDLECRALARGGRIAEAKRRCRAIRRAHPKALEARVVLAQLAASAGELSAAIRYLEEAVRYAPADHESWTLLDTLYQASSRGSSQDRLRQQYRERFGAPLP